VCADAFCPLAPRNKPQAALLSFVFSLKSEETEVLVETGFCCEPVLNQNPLRPSVLQAARNGRRAAAVNQRLLNEDFWELVADLISTLHLMITISAKVIYIPTAKNNCYKRRYHCQACCKIRWIYGIALRKSRLSDCMWGAGINRLNASLRGQEPQRAVPEL